MFYQLYELNHAVMAPFRATADAMNLAWKNPLNPWSHTVVGRSFSAGFEVFERVTRRYTKGIISLLGPDTDVPAPDVNTNERVMAWLMDTYSMHVGRTENAVTTGKPVEMGAQLQNATPVDHHLLPLGGTAAVASAGYQEAQRLDI